MDLIGLRATYASLIVYNFFFYLGKYLPSFTGIQPVYHLIDKYIVYFEILEFLAVTSIFVDLITQYEKKPLVRRRVSLFLCAALFMGFMLKLFVIWFHASIIVD